MTDMLKRYQAAEKLVPWNVKDAVLNGTVRPQAWDETHFLYAKEVRRNGRVVAEFTLVDRNGQETPLFDHKALALLLNEEEIPFRSCTAKDGKIRFVHNDHDWCYDPEKNELTDCGAVQKRAVSVSPDEARELFVRDYDLWLRDCRTNEETRLTYDGEKDYAYAKTAEFSGYITDRVKGLPEVPDVLWSPDSRRFLTYRLDQRGVRDLYIIQSYDDEHLESIRPRLHTYKCSFPEDDRIPMAHWYIGDAESGTLTAVDLDPQPVGGPLFSGHYNRAKWFADSSAVFTAPVTRAHKEASFAVMYPDGSARTILKETTEDFINLGTYGNLDGFNDYFASNFITEDGKTVIWQSEREDLARLYAYDAETGKLKKPITPAGMEVGELVYRDDETQYVYFMASNMAGTTDPYYRRLCRVRYDGTDFSLLTPEDGMHSCTFCAGMIIDTWSRVDKAPVTNLRRPDGTLIRELLEADISVLMEKGYILPERFTVTASDGETTLYGILIKPADFDPAKTYPFIDYIYGGMQMYNVPKAFQYTASIEGREIMGGLEELAQLGFAGIILDGLGTPGRGKKLHSISYENIHGCAGLKDHVTSLPELKEKFPFLDLERAGMWGNSGGGCATSRAMLEYPDVYKVGVSSAGNHDQRMYNNQWTENYYGLYNREIYLKGDNTALAKNLKGHLYIVHGAMDDNVAMSESIRLIDALIKEDKYFDFLILPRTNHNVPANPYFIRRKMDYFVKYLLKEEVPVDYHFEIPA